MRFRDISLEHILTPPFVKQFLNPAFYSYENVSKEIILNRVQQHLACITQVNVRNYLIQRCRNEPESARAILEQSQSIQNIKTMTDSHLKFISTTVESYLQSIIDIIITSKPLPLSYTNNPTTDPILCWITSEDEHLKNSLLLYCQEVLNKANIYVKNINEFINKRETQSRCNKLSIKEHPEAIEISSLLAYITSYGSSFCIGLCSLFAYMAYHGYLIRHAKETGVIDE